MTDLNSLMMFARVVEAKSFSEAARRLRMPTSTVSRRVADLEEQLGVRLIERSTRSLRLTDVGSEVFEQAKHSSEISEAVDNIASNRLSTVTGELRLAAPPSTPTLCSRPWSAPSRHPIPMSASKYSSPTGSSIKSPRASIWRSGAPHNTKIPGSSRARSDLPAPADREPRLSGRSRAAAETGVG